MHLSFLDVDRVSEYLIPVTNFKFLEYKKFPPDGLFSLEIFGPLFSYKCGCSKNSFKGPNSPKKVCSKCNVEIISSSYREKRYSYIQLPYKVFNPLFMNLFMKKSTISKNIEEILFHKKEYEVKEGENLNLAIIREVSEYIHKLIDENAISKELSEFILKNEKHLFIDKILIIPPEYRPCVELPNKVFVSDELNRFYSNILRYTNHINNMIISLDDSKNIFLYNFRNIQRQVFAIYEYVVKKLGGKKGLIRHNILGKRVDFSGRSVIVPDPTLNIRECGLSYNMVLEILKSPFLHYLINKKYSDKSNDILEMIDDSLKNKDYRFFNELSDFTRNMYCVLNRQPSLHRMSILAFKIRLHKENVIKLHPLVCSPYNADFDGDAMAVYIPITEEGQKDIKDYLFIGNNLVSPTNLESICKPSQDIVLGIYDLTKEDIPRTRHYKGKDITEGRYRFNLCLPEDYKLIDEPVDKNFLYSIFDDICFRYNSQIAMDVMDKIKNLGFEVSTLEGYTISISDVYIPEIINMRKRLSGDISKDLEFIKNNNKLNKLISNIPISVFVKSGARGSIEQERQLVFCRGYVADSKNMVRHNLIKNSFSSGLNMKEFFESCFGTRKGLLDTALSTGDSGYLNRQLIYSNCFVELDENLEDCGSEDYLSFYVKDEQYVSSVLGRYFRDPVNKKLRTVTPTNYGEIIGKNIELRSPIYCKSKKICKVCYGKFYKVLHSPQIGIIATQAVGERSTQLVLRTFHISGAVQDINKDKESERRRNQDIISGMRIAKSIFHNPYNLLLANEIRNFGDNVSKEDIKKIKENMNTYPSILLNILFSIFNKFGRIHLIHFEIIISSMMWSGDRLWRLLENRNKVKYEYTSILKIPSKVSWLLGISFSHVNRGLINGLLGKGYEEDTSLTELFKF